MKSNELKIVESEAIEGLTKLSQELWAEFGVTKERTLTSVQPQCKSKSTKQKSKSKPKGKRRFNGISEGDPIAESYPSKQKIIESELPSDGALLNVVEGGKVKGNSNGTKNYQLRQAKLPFDSLKQIEQPLSIDRTQNYTSCLIHVHIAQFITMSISNVKLLHYSIDKHN